jgi:hypothetical protein
MAGVRAIKEKYERLRKSLPAIAENSLDAVKESYVQLNKDQLEEGLSSTGNNFSQYASYDYAIRKNQLNPKPGFGNPDLKLEGSYYRGMKSIVENGKLKVTSTDEKATKLEKKYSADEIYGLNTENKNEFVQKKLKPVYYQNIQQNLNA